MLSQTELKTVLTYDTDTGIFTWLASGATAGTLNNKNYTVIMIKRKSYRAHRLAWLYMTGSMPVEQIDHKNGIRNDNRWCNLREATNSQNMMNKVTHKNNTSGYKGVHWDKSCKRWKAYIEHDNKRIYLGSYQCAKTAGLVYKEKALSLFGQFYKYI